MLLWLYSVCKFAASKHERDERHGASNDFISLTSQFPFIDESSKDERATRIL